MDRDSFRQIMGLFATGVTVVTTSLRGKLHGITVNSLTSVSLDPLRLLVCIDTDSRAHDEIEGAGRFGVNFLRVDQEALSRLFAVSRSPEQDRLRGVPFRIGPHGSPLLDDCLAHLECAVAERFAGGDHTIFLGTVLGGQSGPAGRPLLFYRGLYHTVVE